MGLMFMAKLQETLIRVSEVTREIWRGFSFMME
jgi:hypothetical protein